MERARIPGLAPGQRHPDWTTLYKAVPEAALPWYTPRLDPDMEWELLKEPTTHEVLDLGCGLGGQAALIARHGFQVTAVDISEHAIERATELHEGPVFLVDDITSTQLDMRFDIIVDRGCLHVLPASQHAQYLHNVCLLLRERGLILLKVLSDECGKADFGPLRFSSSQIQKLFQKNFEVVRMDKSVYQGSTLNPPPAWFVVLRKKGGKK